MKIKLVSDLHLEFSDINIKNDEGCDLLILSGDIMVANDLYDHPEPQTPYTPEVIKTLGSRQRCALRYRDFLKRVSFQFPHVIYIAGNHEFYHGKWVKSIQVLRDECAKYPNIYFLEQDTKTIDGIVFMGGTVWTDMDRGNPMVLHAVQSMMQDYNLIRNDELGYTKLRPAHSMSRHRKTLEYFKIVLDQNKDKPCVVVGHHAPSHLSIHEMYQNDSLTNFAYYSNLSEFILDHPQIKLWTHGHMHNTFDYQIGDTRVVCNPRGYEGYEPNSGWNPNLVLEI